MLATRRTTLLASLLTLGALVLAHRALRHSPDLYLVARWWPSTAMATALLVLVPRSRTAPLAGLVVVMFTAAGLVAGHGVFFAFGFAVINAVEALLVLWWLTRFRDETPEMHTWSDYRRWLAAVSVAALLAGVLTALLLTVLTGVLPWRTVMWVAITHLGAQTVVLPLAMRWPRQRLQVSPLEVGAHLALFALGGFATVGAGPSQAVAFLLLPLLMWAAARFSNRWARVELLLSACGLAVLTASDLGPFDPLRGDLGVLDIAASPQTFVAVSGVTVVAFAVAMSHLRESLRRIRENELQLGELLDSASGTAFIATDAEGTITLFSPGAEQLLGYTAAEVVGRTTPMPFHETREVVERAAELGILPGYRVVTAPLDRGAEQDTRDWTYLRKDGSRLTVSLSATAVRDRDGRPASYLCVVRDVTDRRAAEEALVFALDKEREANRQMQELDKAKSEFVSAVSHELRTPLSSIIGYTELLGDGLSGELSREQAELVGRIERNGERLLHLVEDLLMLARVEEDRLDLDRTPTDLRDAVSAATEAVVCAATKGAVTVRTELPEEPATLLGDRAALERLAVNLIGNAVKFNRPGGTVDVVLSVKGQVAQLRVSDTGMGIPEAEQDRLFQRFFRSSLATEHAIQGTGLGLNIVRSIAEAHEGRITFSSTPGTGSTFVFTVPLGSGRREERSAGGPRDGGAGGSGEGAPADQPAPTRRLSGRRLPGRRQR